MMCISPLAPVLWLVRRCQVTRWLWKRRATIAGMVCSFMVTVAGVFVALYLSDFSQSRLAGAATIARIRMAELETQYVMTDALSVCRNAAAHEAGALFLLSFELLAARALLEDDNAPHLLPAHVLSLVKTYVAAASTLQRTIDVHREFGVATGFQDTPSGGDLLEAIRGNAASLVANAYVVQEKLASYKATYDREALRSAEARIRETREAVLAGRVQLATDLTEP